MSCRRVPRRVWAATASLSLTAAVAAMVVGVGPATAATGTVGLGTAGSFAVLAGSTVTNTGPSVIAGDLGVSPGTAVTGFPPGLVNGSIEAASPVALKAESDLVVAYDDAGSRATTAAVSADLGGQTLVPGVYTGPTLSLTGTLTLDAQGNPDAVFIFRSASTLITASDSRVAFINGASPCNVFWQVASSATLGTNSVFVGTTLALTSVTANTGATITGRLLARNAAVTLDDNVVTRPQCAVVPPPTTTTSSTTTTASPTPTSTPTRTRAVGRAPVRPWGRTGGTVPGMVTGTSPVPEASILPAPASGAPHTGEAGSENPLNTWVAAGLLAAAAGVATRLVGRLRKN